MSLNVCPRVLCASGGIYDVTTSGHRTFSLKRLLRGQLCFFLRYHRDYLLKDILASHLLHPGLVRTQLRIDGKPRRSGLRSQQVTVTPVGGDPQYLLQLLQSQGRLFDITNRGMTW